MIQSNILLTVKEWQIENKMHTKLYARAAQLLTQKHTQTQSEKVKEKPKKNFRI